MHRYICKKCGAYLDPGEKCDCAGLKEILKKKQQKLYKVEKDGQIRMNIGG